MANEIPEFVGINSFGLDFYDDGMFSMCTSDVYYQNESLSAYNPKTSPLTILKVKNHFKKYGDKYLKILIEKV